MTDVIEVMKISIDQESTKIKIENMIMININQMSGANKK